MQAKPSQAKPSQAKPSQAKPSQAKPILLSLALSLSWAISENAYAQSGTCFSSNNANYDNKNKENIYKINKNDALTFNSISSENEAIYSTVLSGDLWNNYGNGGYFKYTGTTSTEDLPEDLTDCQSQNINYSLVRFVDTCVSDKTATTFGKCTDSNGIATQFQIEIYRQRNDLDPNQPNTCIDVPFVNGLISNGRDITAIILHEMGHALNIGHPQNAESATMMRPDSIMRGYHRDFFQYDFKCSREQSGTRSVSGYYKTHNLDGTFGSTTKFTGTKSIIKASSGVSFDQNSNSFWCSSTHATNQIEWDGNLDNTIVGMTHIGNKNGIGFATPSVWREDTSVDRVIYSYWEDSSGIYNDIASVHKIRQTHTPDEFMTQYNNQLKYCSTPSGWYTCSSTSDLQSSGLMSFAWIDGSVDRTVMAWMNQDRSSGGSSNASNQIYISVGYTGNTTIAKYVQTNIKTSISPSIACLENFSGTFDCVLAYVPASDRTLNIKTRIFEIDSDSNNYYATLDSTDYSVGSSSRTASPMALWYHQGTSKFYLAYRDASSNQNIKIYNSSNGTSWQLVNSNLDYSITGPSAASIWRGNNNKLVLTK